MAILIHHILCALQSPGVLTLTFSSRADILSLRWSCSLSLDSERSLSTVSDRRLLCSSFIFSLCRACMKKRTTSLQQVKVVKLGWTAPHFSTLTLSSSWFFSSSWASSCRSLSSTLPWRSSAWKWPSQKSYSLLFYNGCASKFSL